MLGGAVVLGNRQVVRQHAVVGHHGSLHAEGSGGGLLKPVEEEVATGSEGCDGSIDFGDAVAEGNQGRRALIAVFVSSVQTLDERERLTRGDTL